MKVKDNARQQASSAQRTNSQPAEQVSSGSSGRRAEGRRGTTPEQTDRTEVSQEAGGSQGLAGGLSSLVSGVMDWAGGIADRASSAPESQTSSPESPRLELAQGEFLSAGRENPEQISQLQSMLNGGGGQLEVDGVFGPRTAEAVRNFQRENGLQADGIVGPQTLAALNGGRQERAEGPRPSEQAGPDQSREAGAREPDQSGTAGEIEQAQAPGEVSGANSTSRLQGIPDRAEGALGGRAFMESIAHLPPGRERNQAVLNEILSGNIPNTSRELRELVIDRNGREIRLNAMSDYLAIGSDEDNVRVPMTPEVAQAIADRTGTSLPTDRLVDDIHSQSRPLHMAPMSHDREGIGTYITHDQRIDEQLGSGAAPGEFVSGHKKDLVIPHREGRVAIYGGRWENGGRIQGYSNVHHDGYEDYSHGARLISQQITIDGQPMRLEEALADPSLRSLFTNQTGSFAYR